MSSSLIYIFMFILFRFPVEHLLNKDSHLSLRPNLKPGEIGEYYILINFDFSTNFMNLFILINCYQQKSHIII